MEQASIDETLLAQAGIDAKHFEAAAKLREPVLRIESTLATLSTIASQRLRTATSHQHGQQAIEERFVALGRAHDLWR